MSKKDHSWCLVLVIWGEKYSDKFVDTLVKSVKQHSKGCKHIVLITVSWPPKTVPVFVDQWSGKEWHGNGIRMRTH
jgi:hypothetical protein